MSFEGYYQILCRNGHSRSEDCYADPNFDNSPTREWHGTEDMEWPVWHCTCHAVAAWWNLVNTTNGSYYEDERIDGYVELEVATEPDTCVCKCGHTHSKGGENPTYKLPDGDEGHTVNGGLNEQNQKSAQQGEEAKGTGG